MNSTNLPPAFYFAIIIPSLIGFSCFLILFVIFCWFCIIIIIFFCNNSCSNEKGLNCFLWMICIPILCFDFIGDSCDKLKNIGVRIIESCQSCHYSSELEKERREMKRKEKIEKNVLEFHEKMDIVSFNKIHPI